MNKYTRQNESLYIKPKRQKNDEKNGCIFLSAPDNYHDRKRWINKIIRLEQIKNEKMWHRASLGCEIIMRNSDLGINPEWISPFKRVEIYKQDVQERWDKRRNDRLVRGLISVTEHVTLEGKRRM